MLHKRGLAYQAEATVNYDPIDKTVLANEQVRMYRQQSLYQPADDDRSVQTVDLGDQAQSWKSSSSSSGSSA
jgi:leucyl-tRNA synthetase